MKRIVHTLLLFSGLTSCDDPNAEVTKDTPACLRTTIEDLAESAPCKTDARTTGANVKEYRFQNRTVYVISQGSCISDGSSLVVDTNCQTLGYLGGFTGNMIVNGESFANAEYKRTVWQK